MPSNLQSTQGEHDPENDLRPSRNVEGFDQREWKNANRYISHNIKRRVRKPRELRLANPTACS